MVVLSETFFFLALSTSSVIDTANDASKIQKEVKVHEIHSSIDDNRPTSLLQCYSENRKIRARGTRGEDDNRDRRKAN